jgi:tRNA pseudouridine13 synthase
MDDLRPRGTIREHAEDFVVDEIPAYPASGAGEHLFVRFRKTNLDTRAAVRAIADALGVAARDAGYAGMKDRRAITTQWASFPFPADRDEGALGALSLPGIELCEWQRHRHKLKTGHLRANRFAIVVRGLDEAACEQAASRLGAIAQVGLPNAYGDQRFGRDGDNATRALCWLRGEERGPRDKRQQRLLVSALQSALFNQVLSEREIDGSWNRVLPGDLAVRRDSGGLFLVPLEGPETADAIERAVQGDICASGPMVGAKMRWPEGAPLELERRIVAAALGEGGERAIARRLGPGTRRPLRLWVDQLKWQPNARDSYLKVEFVLPKGGYATTLLERVFRLDEAKSSGSDVPRTESPLEAGAAGQ